VGKEEKGGGGAPESFTDVKPGIGSVIWIIESKERRRGVEEARKISESREKEGGKRGRGSAVGKKMVGQVLLSK